MGKSCTTKYRKAKNLLFHVFVLAVTCLAVSVLFWLFYDIFRKGIPWLTGRFLTGYPSRFPRQAGILPGLIGSLYIIVLTAVISVPIGVGCAIYLEEYAPDTRISRFIKINISNLAATPSIVYGLLGMAVFVNAMGFKRSILSGALTMSLVVLPIIIVVSQESLRSVPQHLRHSSFALGATRWQTIRKVVVPTALPGVLTGIILSVSRALGETAPLVMAGAYASTWALPRGIMDSFTALPVQIYDWTSRPQADFKNVAAAGIITLIGLLIVVNAAAVFIRIRFRKNIE